MQKTTLCLLENLNQTEDFKQILQDLGKRYSALNVDLVFKNSLTDRLIQISIVFFCNYVRKAAPLFINQSP